jgi:hypothetical protein
MYKDIRVAATDDDSLTLHSATNLNKNDIKISTDL